MRSLVSSNKTMRNRTALTGWADLGQLVIWLLWSWPKALLSSLYAVILKQRVIKPKKISWPLHSNSKFLILKKIASMVMVTYWVNHATT
jgi:hypothetical protein